MMRLAPLTRSLAWRPAVEDHAPTQRVNTLVRVALYVYVLSIPFEYPGRTIPIEIPTLFGFVFLFATLLQPSVCFRRIPTPVRWFVLYLWLFGLSVVLNGVGHGEQVVRLFLSYCQLILILLVIYNLMAADDRVAKGVLLSLAIGVIVRAGIQLLGIATVSHEEWTGGVRVTTLGQNVNLSAIILSAGLVAVVGLQVSAARSFPRLGPLTWPVALLIGIAIIQTGSRGGLMCAAVGAAALMLHSRTIGVRIRNAIVAVLAIGLLGWGAYESEVMRGRFEYAAEEGQLAGREQIYPAAFQMFKERPFRGWGPIGNQFEISRRIRDREDAQRDAHNIVLELVTTTGIFGAFVYLTAIALCITAAWRARHGPLGIIPLALLAAVLVGSLTHTWIVSKIFWLALAIAAAAPRVGAATAVGRS